MYYLLSKKELKIKYTYIHCLATKRHRKDTPDTNEMGYLQGVGGNVKSRGIRKGKGNSLNIPFFHISYLQNHVNASYIQEKSIKSTKY